MRRWLALVPVLVLLLTACWPHQQWPPAFPKPSPSVTSPNPYPPATPKTSASPGPSSTFTPSPSPTTTAATTTTTVPKTTATPTTTTSPAPLTASWYNCTGLYAASPTLAFGTRVKVVNLHNGASVIVTINDRGPYGYPGRVLDLCQTAFVALAPLSAGIVYIRMTILAPSTVALPSPTFSPTPSPSPTPTKVTTTTTAAPNLCYTRNPHSLKGLDYTTPPSSYQLNQMQAQGFKFAVRYVGGGTWKRIYLSEAKALTNHHIRIGIVFEAGTNRMDQGYAAGQADAQAAYAQARNAGAPKCFAIYFAHDEDGWSGAPANAYLNGVKSILGCHRAGIYGGYWAVYYARQHWHQICGTAHFWTWQTFAWSGGRVLAGIDLFQGYPVSPGGMSADGDHAYSSAGMWYVGTGLVARIGQVIPIILVLVIGGGALYFLRRRSRR